MKYFSLSWLYRFAVLLSLWLGLASWGEVSAQSAAGIVVDAEGGVYFADVERDRVWKITWRGALVQLLKGKHSPGLFLDTAANLYGEHQHWDVAAGQWKNSHWRFNATDKLSELGEPPNGVSLVRDTAGNQFGVERDAQTMRLFKRTSGGELTILAGGARGHADGQGAQARFMDIEALFLGADGLLYISDAGRIRRVTAAGVVNTLSNESLARLPQAGQPVVFGLAADTRGNVFVADAAQGVVRKLNPDSRVETVLQTGWFWAPAAVAVANEELYVLEALPEYPWRLLAVSGIGPYLRVQKLAADGSIQTLATVWGTTTRLLLGGTILLGALIALWRLRQREAHSVWIN